LRISAIRGDRGGEAWEDENYSPPASGGKDFKRRSLGPPQRTVITNSLIPGDCQASAVLRVCALARMSFHLLYQVRGRACGWTGACVCGGVIVSECVCVCVVRSYGDLSSVDGFPRAEKNLDDSNANRDSISKP
jgi:hypothetical protein